MTVDFRKDESNVVEFADFLSQGRALIETRSWINFCPRIRSNLFAVHSAIRWSFLRAASFFDHFFAGRRRNSGSESQ